MKELHVFKLHENGVPTLDGHLIKGLTGYSLDVSKGVAPTLTLKLEVKLSPVVRTAEDLSALGFD